MSSVYERVAKGDLDAVGKRLEVSVEARNFGVISVLDLQAKMKEKGVLFKNPCRIYEVCNPHKAKLVLEGDMRISAALPCRISLYAESGQVKLAALLPSETLRLFDVQGLEPLADEIDAVIKNIIDEATGL